MATVHCMKFTRQLGSDGAAPAALTISAAVAVAAAYTVAQWEALVRGETAGLVVVDQTNNQFPKGVRRVFQPVGVGDEGETVKGEVYAAISATRDGAQIVETYYLGEFTGTLGTQACLRVTTGEAVAEQLVYCKQVEFATSGVLAALLGGQADVTKSGSGSEPGFIACYGSAVFRGYIVAPYKGTADGVDVRDGLIG